MKDSCLSNREIVRIGVDAHHVWLAKIISKSAVLDFRRKGALLNKVWKCSTIVYVHLPGLLVGSLTSKSAEPCSEVFRKLASVGQETHGS